MDSPFKHLVLQGDADAAGFTINNLDLSGLNLTKSSVGLGNVDNTSDANKPVSTAMAAALALKEPSITAGTAAQYWRGDKTWQTLGALALQGGNTTLQEFSVIGLNATGAAFIAARRNDWASSFADLSLGYYGASHVGSILGLSAANAAALKFQNSTLAFIYSNNASPLVFGYNGIRRMRLMTGLNVGGDTDPGSGCIEAADTITADHFEGDDLVLTGGATLGNDLVLSGGGSNLTVGGNATVAGSIDATSNIQTAANLVSGGNLAVTGTIISFANLPTSNPGGAAGQVWRSGTDLKITV